MILFYFMLPNPHNVKSLFPQLSALSIISLTIFLNFFVPEFPMLNRFPSIADRTSVPKTAINKNHKPVFGKKEIGFSKNAFGVFFPSIESFFRQSCFNCEFSGFITRRTNP